MAQISLQGVTFAYDGGEPVFRDADLTLDTGWRLGLVGRNGRGKTTLLRLLAGELRPQRGRVSVPGRPLYYPFGRADPALDARSLLVRLRRGSPGWALEREAGLMGLPDGILGRPLGTLSGGERAKVMLCLLFLEEGDFPLIDEPTASLDLEGRRTVASYLAAKGGFVLASHDRALLDGASDHVLAINRQGLELVRGGYSAWEEQRRRADLEEEAKAARLAGEISRLRASAVRGARWAGLAEGEKFGRGPVDRGFVGHKAAKMQKRAKAVSARREKALEERSSMARNAEPPSRLAMSPLRFRGPRLAAGTDLSCGYGEGRPVFAGLTFTIENGSRTALTGGNGSGKTLLLRLLAGGRALAGPGILAGGLSRGGAGEAPAWAARRGDDACPAGAGYPGVAVPLEPAGPGGAGVPPAGGVPQAAAEPQAAGRESPAEWILAGGGIWTRGLFLRPPGLEVSYVPQEPAFSEGDTLRDLALAAGADEGRYKTVLRHLGFGRDRLSARAVEMSRGQMKKAILGLSLCDRAHLYLWDEPLDVVDVMTRIQLEELIAEARPTLVVVEHDLAFLERLGFLTIDLGRHAARAGGGRGGA
jgi:lincosamide and streptogramin A transport system ATP-binding/permease protein